MKTAQRIAACLCLCLVLIMSYAKADVRELSIEYNRLHESSRVAEMFPHKPKESLALNMNIDIIGPLHWDNTIHATTDDGQYRMVGWQFFFGINPLKWIDIGYRHHSQHIMGAPELPMGFPIEDSLCVKLYIVRTQ